MASVAEPVHRYGAVAPALYQAILNRCVAPDAVCMDQMMAADNARSKSGVVKREGAHPGVDAPASGQALSMIRTPFAARETFGDSVVGREARNIVGLLSDRAKRRKALRGNFRHKGKFLRRMSTSAHQNFEHPAARRVSQQRGDDVCFRV